MKAALPTADAYEVAFYDAQNAKSVTELKIIEGMIDALTPDQEQRAELLNAILKRMAELNAEAVGNFKPRWN